MFDHSCRWIPSRNYHETQRLKFKTVVLMVHPYHSRSQKSFQARKSLLQSSRIQLQNHLDNHWTLRDTEIILRRGLSLDRSSTASFESFVFIEEFEDYPNVRVPSFMEGWQYPRVRGNLPWCEDTSEVSNINQTCPSFENIRPVGRRKLLDAVGIFG